MIGAGHMGKAHLQALAALSEIEVVALADPHVESARAAAAEFEVPAVYADTTTLLKEERPNYVVAASPPLYHAEQVIAAFEAGAHVLCEKPLCMNAVEAEAMKAAAEKSGRLFTMGLQLRQMHMYEAVREFVAGGKLGQVYHARVWAGHIMEYPYGRFFHRTEYSLGGVLAATAVHFLDLAMWLLGSPQPVAVSASTFRRIDKMPDPPVHFEGEAGDSDVEDFVHAHVRFADGCSMSVEGNWLMHPCSDQAGVEINGVLGVIRVKEEDSLVELEDRDSIVPLKLEHEPEHENRLVEQHKVFLDAMNGEREPVVTFREAVEVQKIINGVYESAESGEEVRL